MKKRKNVSTTFLNKSEATYFLHLLHDTAIRKMRLENEHPDFYSLINENLRDPYSISALIAGQPRGNARKYGRIDHLRIGGRPMFTRQHLKAWFLTFYLPTMRKAA